MDGTLAVRMTITASPTSRHFPISAGIFFGLGLGGFFDGIVLHQVLQWHHMLSSWFPVNTIENLELNTRWDGIFHSTTYLFVLIGLFLLWRTAHRKHLYWSSKLLIGTMLLGFGIFNTVEGPPDRHPSRQRNGGPRILTDLGYSLHPVGRGDDYHWLDGHARRAA